MGRIEKRLYREFYNNFKVPSREVLDENLRTLGRWLDGDFREDLSEDVEEIQKRIRDRISEQATVIYPKRILEGKVTPAWEAFIRRHQPKKTV